ncbi:unnamed protein product, partial [Phaeothamnion confervicola]
LKRIGEQINVILTAIYGKYVAQGCPTKLGGLRFLDVESAKTFAFEQTQETEGGNLLVLSAPVSDNREELEAKLKAGPHAELLRDIFVRNSPDVGKKNKFFVEVTFFLDTPAWLTDEAVSAVMERDNINGNDAIIVLLKKHVLPIAAALMDHFITSLR